MRYILTMAGVLTLSGCVHYANIERTRMGMTVNELLAIDTPCYYHSETDNTVNYNCRFSVPSGRHGENRSIKPYIMTFEDGKLTEIRINEEQLDRESLRDEFYYRHHFNYYPYPFGYGFYGYPY